MISSTWRISWLSVLLFFTCEWTGTYQKVVALEHDQWPVAHVLDFSFSIEDAAQAYDVCLLVKNTQAYPYQNLYVTYYLEDATQHLLDTKLKNYAIFDAKTGKPLGKGLWKNKRHRFSLVANHRFPRPGSYTLKLVQFMRTDLLPGLQAVGIRVMRSKQISQ